jgi:fermentation-respiration switch protein FrsA (DUF1100 family)
MLTNKVPVAPRTSARRLLVLLFSPLLLGYLGVILVLLWLENTLVFHPASAAENWQKPSPGIVVEDVWLPTKHGRLHALWRDRPGWTPADGAVIAFHGNGGNVSFWLDLEDVYEHALGLPVLLVEYPGYGKSEGTPTEAGLYAAADAGYAWLRDTQHVEPQRIVIHGESLGGAVAVDLASRQPCRLLVLARTFTTLPDVAAEVYPWLPVRWMMSNRFDSLSKIGSCRCPLFQTHGDRDSLVPFAMSQRLFAAANEPKRFVPQVGADHNDPFPAEFVTELRRFVQDVEKK